MYTSICNNLSWSLQVGCGSPFTRLAPEYLTALRVWCTRCPPRELEAADPFRFALPARMCTPACGSEYVTSRSIGLSRYSDAVASLSPPPSYICPSIFSVVFRRFSSDILDVSTVCLSHSHFISCLSRRIQCCLNTYAQLGVRPTLLLLLL